MCEGGVVGMEGSALGMSWFSSHSATMEQCDFREVLFSLVLCFVSPFAKGQCLWCLREESSLCFYPSQRLVCLGVQSFTQR